MGMMLLGLGGLQNPKIIVVSQRNSRKTECGVKQFLAGLVARAAPFALLRQSESKRSSIAALGLDPDRSAMLFDDSLANG
jgi:hypothetical protein